MSTDRRQQPERIGAYIVEGPLGRGGMGEVYRAHDAKLRRDVAIKVLPSQFVNDSERLSRFQREARVLASLNHPNIASIYGLEDSGTTRALVMELVEGPTLADRIRNGPIPIDEALSIARQICSGLEYAHEDGIVHRDLKPANIKVTADGGVKILDFGLAKVLTDNTLVDISDSTTISLNATQNGILLGTPAYMAPEQAKGKRVDRRADIWAFGCVLFEMLTGKTPFHGETVTETLSAVLSAQPDWSLLPAKTPQQVRVLLQRCLQKDVRGRLQAIGEARIVLEEILSGAPQSDRPASRPWARWVWLAAGIASLAVAAAVTFAILDLKPSAKPAAVTRFTVTLPQGQQIADGNASVLALSPDASHLAYVAKQAGVQKLYLRAMDRDDAISIDGSDGATSPFFSPDGQWLGFIADAKLKKVSVKGGIAQELAVVGEYSSGATWTDEHTIVFAPYSSVLHQVTDEKRASPPVTQFENGESLHMWPQVLPGGKALLFTAWNSGKPTIAVQRIGGERQNLIQGQGASMASYASGRLFYAQAGNLMSLPFDLDSLQVKKGSVPTVVASNIAQSTSTGAAQYSVSSTGSLVYVSGGVRELPKSELVWVDRRDQKERPVGAPPRAYNQPSVSPDGTHVAVDVVEATEKMQVWLFDVDRQTFTPFTYESVNRHAVWEKDSKRLIFMSNREGPTQIFRQEVDGRGAAERLTRNQLTAAGDILQIPYSISQNGLLTFIKLVRPTEPEFYVLPVGDASAETQRSGKEQQITGVRAVQDGGLELSPDGHWLAYASEESGQRQIYVQAFPGPGGKQMVSTDGGNEPRWNPNSRELFYRNGDLMMAVGISSQGLPEGKAHVLFQGNYVRTGGGWVRPNYDVSSDGQHFLMLKPVAQSQSPLTEIHVVLNWSEELKRVAPTENR